MPKTLSELRRALRRSRSRADGRKRFRPELRQQVAEAAIAARAEGQSISKSARQLGISDQLLGRWVRASSDAPAVRPIEVVDDTPAPVTTGLRLVLPGGAAIEGLSLDDVAQLLRVAR